MNKKKLGIEQLKNGFWAVIDLSTPYTVFSKLLSPEEERELKNNDKLPTGVTQKICFSPVIVVETYKAAASIKNGEKPIYPDKTFGIFQSYGQYLKAKKILSVN